LFVLFLLLSASFPTSPAEILGEVEGETGLYYTVQSILVLIMITFAVIAIAGYLIGQMFGAETRARITVWSTGLLSAVGVAALVIILFAFFVPFFEGRGASEADLTQLLRDLHTITKQSLIFLIFTLLIVAAAVYLAGQAFGAETRAKANVWSQVLLGSTIVAAIIYVILFEVLTNVIIGMDISYEVGGRIVPLNIYMEIIILVVFIISAIVLITYLAAKIFKVPEWEAYLNVELSNLMNSFLLLIFIAGFFAVSALVSISIVGESSPPLAGVKVVQGITDNVLEGVLDVYTIQACTSVLATFHRRIGEAVLTPTFRVFPGIDTFVSISNVLAIGFVMVYGSLSAQIVLLNIVDAVMVPFILPAGLILRFFPPTREAGAFLIALAFGFQIIFPTVYVINSMALEDIQLTKYDTAASPASFLCGLGYAYASIPPIIGDLILPFNLMSKLMPLFSEGVVHALSMAMFIPVLKALSSVSLLALFAPAVAMILTVASINAMTKFIVMKG